MRTFKKMATAAILCAAGSLAAVNANPNFMTRNAGFENNSQDWVVTGDVSFSSQYSPTTAAIVDGEGGLQYEISIDVSEFTGYTLKFMAQNEGQVQWSGVGVDYLDASGNEIGEWYVAGFSGSWSQQIISRSFPQGTQQVRIWTWKAGEAGKTMLDEFILNLSGANDHLVALTYADNYVCDNPELYKCQSDWKIKGFNRNSGALVDIATLPVSYASSPPSKGGNSTVFWRWHTGGNIVVGVDSVEATTISINGSGTIAPLYLNNEQHIGAILATDGAGSVGNSSYYVFRQYDSLSISAWPDAGHEFTGWNFAYAQRGCGSVDVYLEDSLALSTYLHSDKFYYCSEAPVVVATAQFEPAAQDYSVIVSYNDDGGCEPTSFPTCTTIAYVDTIPVNHGQTIDLFSAVNPFIDWEPYGPTGTTFYRWNSTGSVSIADAYANQTQATIYSNATISAENVSMGADVRFLSDGNGQVSSQNQENRFFLKDSVDIYAIPSSGYVFSHWDVAFTGGDSNYIRLLINDTLLSSATLSVETFQPVLGYPAYSVTAVFAPVAAQNAIPVYNDTLVPAFSTNDATAQQSSGDSFEGNLALQVHFGPASDWWAYTNLDLVEAVDASSASYLQFAIKATSGTIPVRVKLKNSYPWADGNFVAVQPTAQWQVVQIPVSQLNDGTLNLSAIDEIELNINSNQSTSILIDDISFIE